MERGDFAGSDPEATDFLGPAERGRAGCVAEHARGDVPDHGSDTHSTRVEVLRCWVTVHSPPTSDLEENATRSLKLPTQDKN